MKALYAYFGMLELHSIDSPGHSLYQIGLMDSIRESFDVNSFDFFSYYPEEVQKEHLNSEGRTYPVNPLGDLFEEYKNDMVEQRVSLDQVLEKIKTQEYDRLFLKARFRNISTLQKKWKDARYFELIIEAAIEHGYAKEKIIILDTDLSLPDSFVKEYGHAVNIQIPSIDFAGVSNRFLLKCVEIHVGNYFRKNNTVFYGNIDTSSYKSGNSKSPILNDVLNWCEDRSDRDRNFIVISKQKDLDGLCNNTHGVLRNNRRMIWEALQESLVMINVTKDKYDERRFIPARIYEAMIFGMIPVSYKFNFLCETFSFLNLDDLLEIIKYLNDCDHEDRKKAYLHFIDSYLRYAKSISIKLA